MNFTDLELFGAGTAVSDTFGDHAVGHFTLVVQLQQHRHSTQHLHTSADIEAHPNWPVYADVFEHPPPRLASRRPIWSDMTSVDTITQWREDWSLASVVNHTTVTDPTI